MRPEGFEIYVLDLDTGPLAVLTAPATGDDMDPAYELFRRCRAAAFGRRSRPPCCMPAAASARTG